MKTPTFSYLFKKYRLKSEFETLSEFGDALASAGLIYDNSILSRWQKGERIPRDRRLILTLIKIFISKGGLSSLDEINSFIESTGQGYLTESECKNLPENFLLGAPFQVPQEISHFTGRREYITKIKRKILDNRVVVISGIAGVGKTSLAIQLGHIFNSEFPDGVLWYRLDTTDPMNILSSIALAFDENISDIKSLEIRASFVRSILSTKKVLLILDNAESSNKINLFIPNSSGSKVIVTTRSKNIQIPTSCILVNLDVFSLNESFAIFKKILGLEYVKRNRSKLQNLALNLGNLPLAIKVSASQLLNSSLNLDFLLKQLKKESINLEQFEYDNADFKAALNVIYKNLRTEERNVFKSLSAFKGKDFSLSVIRSINRISTEKTKLVVNDLVNRSLVENSVTGKYRLHPLIRIFLVKKVSKKSYLRAAMYYISFLKSKDRGNLNTYWLIEAEFDNIKHIFNKCLELKFWNIALELWEYLGIFLWDTGRWGLLKRFGERVFYISHKSKNLEACAKCCIRELSWLYFWQGDMKKARAFVLKGLRLSKKLKDEYLIAYGMQRLGVIQQRSGNYTEAQKDFNHALNYFIEAKELRLLSETYLYLGHLLRKRRKLNKSKYFYFRSLKISSKIKSQEGMSISLYYLGEICLLNKKYQLARKYFKKALELDYKFGRKVGIAWNKWGLGLVELALKNFSKAKTLLEQSKIVYTQLGMYFNIKRVNISIKRAEGKNPNINTIPILLST